MKATLEKDEDLVEASSARRHPAAPQTKTREAQPKPYAFDEDDLVVDVVEEILEEFALSNFGEEADFGVLVLFLERAQRIGVEQLEAICCDDVSRIMLELLHEQRDEENVIDSIAAFTEWIATRGDRSDADEMIDAMFDIDSCELATVHPIAR